MRVWLFQIGQRYDSTRSVEATYDDRIEEALLAESLGFEGIWAAEHHFTNYAAFGNPLVYLAALARETTRLRLGTMGVVLPMHNPVRVAEEAAMVDQLSHGRMELGVARGYTPFEYAALDAEFQDSQALMDEGVEILHRLFSGDDVSHSGPRWPFDELTLVPRPYQGRTPGMWYACGSPSTIKRAMRWKMNVFQSLGIKDISFVKAFNDSLDQELAEQGINRSEVRYGVQVPARLAENAAQHADAAEQLRWMYKLAGSFGGDQQRRKGGFITETGEVKGTDGDAASMTSANLIGGTDHMRRVIEELASFGVTDLSLNFEFGNAGTTERRESMHAVAEVLGLAGAADKTARTAASV